MKKNDRKMVTSMDKIEAAVVSLVVSSCAEITTLLSLIRVKNCS